MKVFLDTSADTKHQHRGIGAYTQNLKIALETQNILLVPNIDQADLIHYPYFDFFFLTLPLSKPKPTIITIHDTIPLIYPQHFPPGIRGKIKFTIQKLSLAGVKSVITDSKSSAHDINKFLKIPPHKIHPILLASSKIFKPSSKTRIKSLKAKYSLPDKFISFVGNINYNKNLSALIKATGQTKANLVINTQANLNSNIPEVKALLTSINQLDDKSQVTFIKLANQQELVDFYSASYAYIQPSLYEGFGLPVLEAFASGTPVFSANTSSLPEVGGSAAVYFNPKNINSICQALTKAYSLTHSQRQSLIKKGLDQTKKFSWAKTAQQTIQVYQSVFNLR